MQIQHPVLRTAFVALAALALAGTPACKDKQEEKKPEAQQKKEAKPGAAKPVAAAKLEVPADVLVYGGSVQLDKALGALHGLASQVAPVPDLKGMIGPAFQGEWRLTDPKVIDLSKPMYFAVLNPKKFGNAPAVVLAPVTSKDALLKALPATGRKEKDAGNEVSYLKFEGAKHPVYVNVIGDYALFTRSADAVPKNMTFFTALTALKVPAQGTAYVEVDNALAIFGKEFDAGLAEARKTMEQAAQASPGGAAQVESIKMMIDYLGQSAREVDQLRASLVTVADGAKLDVWIAPKAGTELAKLVTAMQGSGDNGLIGKLPADAPVLLHASVDNAKFKDVGEKLVNAFVVDPVYGGDKAKAKVYVDAMKVYLDNLGQFAMAGFAGPNGLDLAGIFEVKDGKALREAQATMAKMYDDPAAAEYYTKMGVKVEYTAEAYKVGDVPVSQIKTNLTNMPPEAAAMAGMLNELMNQYIAVGDKLGVIAYGSSAKAVIEGFLSGSTKGGLDQTKGVKRAIANAAANRAVLFYVNLIELVKGIKLGGMNPLAPALKDISAQTGVAMSWGVTNGELQFVLDVPIETVKQGMAAFEKGKGAF